MLVRIFCFIGVRSMKALPELLAAIQNGDQSAFSGLLEAYRSLIASMVQSFSASCPTVDSEDLLQEASLALSDAARSYRIGSTDVTFGLYAKICIRNRLISVQRKNRVKQKKERSETRSLTTVKKISLPQSFSLAECRQVLSRFENEVLTLYSEGRSYQEMAKELSCSVKSIDNALYRIKRKIRILIETQ